jgi:O-antigen/teichoic acid export membrane protein
MEQRAADDGTYRGILRSGSVLAGASIINIGIGILRVKGIALLLGPTGLGLAGLLTSVMTTVSTICGLGLSTSGVRQLAASGGDTARQHHVRTALLIANMLLGVIGGGLVYLFRERLSLLVFGDLAQARNIGWLGPGVLLTMVAASQTALLQGLRKIREIAVANVAGAFIGTIAGLAALSQWGVSALAAVVVLLPAGVAAASGLVASGIERSHARIALSDLLPQWQDMVTLGMAFMLTSLLSETTLLFVRSIIGHTLSMTAAGHFQAAWQISMQYIGFVLAAMLAEYYPRLAAGITNFERTNRAVNAQIQIGLLLGGPVMIAMMTGAPWLVSLLYSDDFGPSVDLLRWQVLGDVLKVASWPMGFVLLAKAERRAFLFTQSLWNGAYALGVFALLPVFGLQVTGIVFLACYTLSFVINLVVVQRVTGFRCSASNFALLGALFAACAATFALASIDPRFGLVGGALLLFLYGGIALARLAHLSHAQDVLPAWSRPLVARLSRFGGIYDG